MTFKMPEYDPVQAAKYRGDAEAAKIENKRIKKLRRGWPPRSKWPPCVCCGTPLAPHFRVHFDPMTPMLETDEILWFGAYGNALCSMRCAVRFVLNLPRTLAAIRSTEAAILALNAQRPSEAKEADNA